MTDLTLREYRPGDGERVRELHEVALREAGGYVESDGDREFEADLGDVEGSYLAPDGATFLVGTVGGRIVAMGALRPVAGHLADLLGPFEGSVGEVKRLRVDSAHQRRGYGRQTLEALEARAREDGHRALVLDTTPAQEAAVGLFEAAGYERVHEERVTALGEPFTLLCYRKEL